MTEKAKDGPASNSGRGVKVKPASTKRTASKQHTAMGTPGVQARQTPYQRLREHLAKQASGNEDRLISTVEGKCFGSDSGKLGSHKLTCLLVALDL